MGVYGVSHVDHIKSAQGCNTLEPRVSSGNLRFAHGLYQGYDYGILPGGPDRVAMLGLVLEEALRSGL